jgi:hypothetical protein
MTFSKKKASGFWYVCLELRLYLGRIEEGCGTGILLPTRFPSPLIKPDVPVSSIRLSDRLHQLAHGSGTQMHIAEP